MKGKRIIALISALAMMSQAGVSAFAEVVVDYTNFNNTSSSAANLTESEVNSLTADSLKSLMNTWNTASDPYFSIVEGDMTAVKYIGESGGLETRTLSWAIPDIDMYTNAQIKSTYWLNPSVYYSGHSESEWRTAFNGVQAYLWGSDGSGKDGVLYENVMEYNAIIDTLAEDLETIGTALNGLDTAKAQIALTYLESYQSLLQSYAELNSEMSLSGVSTNLANSGMLFSLKVDSKTSEQTVGNLTTEIINNYGNALSVYADNSSFVTSYYDWLNAGGTARSFLIDQAGTQELATITNTIKCLYDVYTNIKVASDLFNEEHVFYYKTGESYTFKTNETVVSGTGANTTTQLVPRYTWEDVYMSINGSLKDLLYSGKNYIQEVTYVPYYELSSSNYHLVQLRWASGELNYISDYATYNRTENKTNYHDIMTDMDVDPASLPSWSSVTRDDISKTVISKDIYYVDETLDTSNINSSKYYYATDSHVANVVNTKTTSYHGTGYVVNISFATPTATQQNMYVRIPTRVTYNVAVPSTLLTSLSPLYHLSFDDVDIAIADWYDEENTMLLANSPLPVYLRKCIDILNTLKYNMSTPLQTAVSNMVFENLDNLNVLYDMEDISTYIKSYNSSLSKILEGHWNFKATSEPVEYYQNVTQQGTYSDGSTYDYVTQVRVKNEDNTDAYRVGQVEVTPWVSYLDAINGIDGFETTTTAKMYNSDWLLRNVKDSDPVDTGNPVHPEEYELTDVDVAELNELGFDVTDSDKFVLDSVTLQVSKKGMDEGNAYVANTNVLKKTLTGSDMYNIDMTKLIEEIKSSEFANIPEDSVTALRSIMKDLNYTDSEIEKAVNNYRCTLCDWNSNTGYQVELVYNYVLTCDTIVLELKAVNSANLGANTAFVIPEYSISEYYDTIRNSFTNSELSLLLGSDETLGTIANATLNQDNLDVAEPKILQYYGVTPVSWQTQLSRICTNTSYDGKKVKQGTIETIKSDVEYAQGSTITIDGLDYVVRGYNNGYVTYDTRYYVLSNTKEDGSAGATIIARGDKAISANLADYENYKEFIKAIAADYQPATGHVSSSTDTKNGNVGVYANSLDVSKLGYTPEATAENVVVFKPVAGNTKIFYAVQQASGKSDSAVRKVARLLYPIIQYTVDTTEDTEYNLNNNVYTADNAGNVKVQGTAQSGVLDGALRVFITEECTPVLIWDSNGAIHNYWEGTNELTSQFSLDYYTWLSKTTAEDGIYIADWVNDSPNLYNTSTGKLITTTQTAGGYEPAHNTSTTSVTSKFKSSRVANVALGDGYNLNRAIVFTATPTSGTFSDWMFSRTTGRITPMYYCATCGDFVTDVQKHAFDYINWIYGKVIKFRSTTVIVTRISKGNPVDSPDPTESQTYSFQSLSMLVPYVVHEGGYYKTGFWMQDYLEGYTPRTLTGSCGGVYIENWSVPSSHSSSGGGLDWSGSLGSINISGNISTQTPSGGESSRTVESFPSSDSIEANKKQHEAYLKSKEAELAVLRAKAAEVGGTIEVKETTRGKLYYISILDVPLEGDLGTEMSFGSLLDEPKFSFHALADEREGGRSNPVVYDAIGVADVVTFGSSADIYRIVGMPLVEEEEGNTTNKWDNYYEDAYAAWEEGLKTSKREGFTLQNANRVSALTFTTASYAKTLSGVTSAYSNADISAIESWGSSFMTDLNIYNSFGDGTYLGTNGVKYTPPEGSITFNMVVNGSAVSFGSDSNTTESNTNGVYSCTTTYSNVTNGEGTVITITITCSASASGSPSAAIAQKLAAEKTVEVKDTGSYAFSSISEKIINMPNNDSMVGQVVDTGHNEHMGKYISENAGEVYAEVNGVELKASENNVNEITITTDNVTYKPLTFIKNIQDMNAETTYTGVSNMTAVATKATNVDLAAYTWQSDYVQYSDSYTYNIVPEVLMTYKTDYQGYTTKANATNRGRLGSVYIAGYNEYTMTFPVYNNVEVSYELNEGSTTTSAVATSTKANALSGRRDNKPVWYTGSDASVLYEAQDNNNTISWNSYVLDFVTESSNNKNVALAWNNGYTTQDAVTVAQSYLDGFKENADDTLFTVHGLMTNSFSISNKDTGGDDDVIANAKTNDITIDEKFEFNGDGDVDGDTTKYEELDSLPITIRNARLASIQVNGVTYTFPTNIEATSTALMVTPEFTSFKATEPEIAEAVINMELAEFAGTWVHNGGSESWDKYKSQSIGSGYVDGVKQSVTNYVSDVKTNSGDISFNASDNWYAEDSTVLRIRVFRKTATLPEQMMFSWKIPANYGYKSPVSKSNLFDTSSGAGIFGYCELALIFPNTAPITIDDIATRDNKVAAGWDIIGNEYQGLATIKNGVTPQFVIHNASVEDMY